MRSPESINSICIMGIAGYSGAGKTTLIEKMLPLLKKQGLYIGVIKHSHHVLSIDVKGKDTDRFFQAGADMVFAHDPQQSFFRSGHHDDAPTYMTGRLPSDLDLIIVEGHKDFDIPGIWLEKKSNGIKIAKKDLRGKKVIFRDDPGYLDKALSHIHEEIMSFHAKRTINAGLLIGGMSTRMGSPKALLKIKDKTLVKRSFDTLSEVSDKAVLLGSRLLPESLGAVDRLPDIRGVKGPLAGMLSAFRWDPGSAWIISSVDMPLMRREAWEWLLNQRRPGKWAVLPRIQGSKWVETTGGVYEPMIFEHVESLARKGTTRLQEIALHPKVLSPFIPKALVPAWKNINTPADFERILKFRE